MFESLLEWCTAPIGLVSANKNAAGDLTFGTPVTYSGYRVDKTTVITDKVGKQVVSSAQVYFPPAVPVTENDFLVLPPESKRREIKSLGSFFDGNTGAVSIKVVYL